jgi:hyperosmotically inducible periplasmic protein
MACNFSARQPSREEESFMGRLIHAAVVAALLSLAPFSAACNRQPDVKDHVQQSLKQANIEHVNVDYDKNARVVHLKGNVPNSAERQRAEQVASAAVGTSGTVLNELTVENMDEHTADNQDGAVRDRLKETVSNDPMLKDRDINFDVNNGVVTVKGEVRSAAEKTKVGSIVKSAPGVKDFANELEVRAKR